MNLENFKNEKLLLALSLGDGSIFKQPKQTNCTFQIRHCEAQKEYLVWKRNEVSKILHKNINIHNLINYGEYSASQFAVTNSIFNKIRDILYVDNQKTITSGMLSMLDDLGVSIWYMDDGSLSKKKNKLGIITAYELTISTCCSKQEALLCIDFFKKNYDCKFTLKKMKSFYSIRCGTKSARKLLDKIEKFILTIPCMGYKVIPSEHKEKIGTFNQLSKLSYVDKLIS
jgi:hypothetical protein